MAPALKGAGAAAPLRDDAMIGDGQTVPFARVATGAASTATLYGTIGVLALVQTVVQFRFFPCIGLARSTPDDRPLILFTVLIIVPTAGGTVDPRPPARPRDVARRAGRGAQELKDRRTPDPPHRTAGQASRKTEQILVYGKLPRKFTQPTVSN